jgi:hypothetical protein
MKRFTETTKWRDPWFRRLSPIAKLLWLYLTDNCDCAGLIDLDVEAAAFDIGAKIEEKHLTELASRTQRTIDGKIFIPRFIPFQYGELSVNCPAHKPVIKLVSERTLSMNGKGYQYPNENLAVGLPKPTGKEKDKDRKGKGSEPVETYPYGMGTLSDRVSAKFNQEWVPCRKAMGKKPKDWAVMFQEQVKWLGQFSEADQLEILSASIRNNWQGLFEPKNKGRTEATKPRQKYLEV